MISSRITAFVLGALPLLAVATPLEVRTGKCSTGPLQCCQSVQKATDPAASAALALIDVVVQDVDATVGLDCSPVTVIGVATGNSCNAQTVCCKNNNVVSTAHWQWRASRGSYADHAVHTAGRTSLPRLRPRLPLKRVAHGRVGHAFKASGASPYWGGFMGVGYLLANFPVSLLGRCWSA
ncbi:Fruiting body protein SC3 [Trametes pubescens]|uniref:Hydrophobin n=1 Tax=Trametes pubescens TaxID=154538 RepID=A0A1M2VHK0_TRAPU|nr:Fruiting body protein SC3 [Trametes pubescens]